MVYITVFTDLLGKKRVICILVDVYIAFEHFIKIYIVIQKKSKFLRSQKNIFLRDL